MTDKTKKALLDGIGLAVSLLDMLLLNKILSDHSRRMDGLERRISRLEDARDASEHPDDDIAVIDAALGIEANARVIAGICSALLVKDRRGDKCCVIPTSIRFVDAAKKDRHIMTAELLRNDDGTVHVILKAHVGPKDGRRAHAAYWIAGKADAERDARLICEKACAVAMGERVINKEAVWLDRDAEEYVNAIRQVLDHALDAGTDGRRTCGIATAKGLLPVEITMERTLDGIGRPFLTVLVNDNDRPRSAGESFPAVRYDRQNAGDAALSISRYVLDACGSYGYGCKKNDRPDAS